MSKDCKRSYEEVHKKLGEELEKAYLKRETPEEKIPEFDLSFLEEQHMNRPKKTMRPEKKTLYLRKRRKSVASAGLSRSRQFSSSSCFVRILSCWEEIPPNHMAIKVSFTDCIRV